MNMEKNEKTQSVALDEECQDLNVTEEELSDDQLEGVSGGVYTIPRSDPRGPRK